MLVRREREREREREKLSREEEAIQDECHTVLLGMMMQL